MRLVFRLSPLAKVGAVIFMVGVAVGIYDRMNDVEWARLTSWALVFLGALLYFVERARMFFRRRKL